MNRMSWIQKRRSDLYYQKAKKEGFRSRASYKLIQINEKFNILKNGKKILDLGAAPGGWSQVISSINTDGLNVAVDILPMKPVPGVIFLREDLFSPDIKEKLLAKSASGYDIILSDILMHTSGDKSIDHANSYFILMRILEIAKMILNENGKVLAKMLQGDLTEKIRDEYLTHFRRVRITKPPSSLQGSSEIYILAEGFSKSK